MASLFQKDIQYLKSVGEKRAQLFRKIGAPTVGALLYLFPRTYEDWSNISTIFNAQVGQVCCIKATVASRVTENKIRKGVTIYKAKVYDETEVMDIVFFNNRFAKDKLIQGEEFLFYGRISAGRYKKEMVSPVFDTYVRGKRLRPIYQQTAGLSSRQIENAVNQALLMLPEKINETIPDYIIKKYDLCSLRYAIENIHFPKSHTDLELAKKRLVFEELLILQLGLAKLNCGRGNKRSAVCINDYSEEFYKLLPFDPTNAQKKAVSDCIHDMSSDKITMNRLLQGDVGSGKTAVAAALCYCAAKSGVQAAVMAPTEILSEQHYNSFCELFDGTNVNIALLTGSTKASEKRKIIDGLILGTIDIVIGTHALISDNVMFKNLGLVITDEQHRFGVAQRANLVEKGNNPHILVMSATPIPRTLALIVYGDLDISILDELPPGRQKVETFHVNSSKRARVFTFLKNLIDEGRQCYVVCPIVEEDESNMIAAQQYAEKLQKEDFSNYKVGLIHGKMRSSDKEKVMQDFSCGRIDVLVSTTVIEVGVNVPNAAVMLIENAERFGLSQLHQLRGRVGRGSHKSYCILLSDAQNEETLRRLKIMTQTNDGFKIADEDLKLRGPGDFFGSKQHGLPDLKIANIVKDMSLLMNAQDAAKDILINDSNLEKDENRRLKAQIRIFFNKVGYGGLN